MTFRDKALARTAFCSEYVESIWNDRNTRNIDDLQVFVRQLCLSHERLQAELEGCDILLSECPHCGPYCDLMHRLDKETQ